MAHPDPAAGDGDVGTVRLLHLVFAFLAIFSAEGVSANLPAAPLIPPSYLIYGILYVFFVDSLLRRRVTSWTTVWLYGVLVGYVTESFAAKVMFFGWPDNAANLLGVLPWPEFPLLTFFYHPLFSFLVPVYLARRYLGFPFALPTSPRLDRVLPWLWPGFAVMQVAVAGKPPVPHCLLFALDALVFLGLLAWLKSRGPCRDVRLDPRRRPWLVALLLASYLLWLRILPPYHRDVMMHPSGFQLAFAVGFTLLVLGMVWTRVRELPDPGPLPWDPSDLPLGRLAAYGALVVGIQVAGVLLLAAVPPGLPKLVWVLVFLTGTGGGTLFFLRELGRTRWRQAPTALRPPGRS